MSVVLIAIALPIQPTRADRQPRAKTLDEALLEDLGGNPIGDLSPKRLDVPPSAPAIAPTIPQAVPNTRGDNPLLSIARQMREVESRIDRADCGDATQRTQQEILAELDALIAQARKSCGPCKPCDKNSSSGVQPRKPVTQPCNKSCQGKPGAKASGSNQGQAGRANPKTPDTRRADLEQTRTLMKRLWGELPPHDREQMLQRPVEEFLPKYELLIEDYFRRLSEEKGAPRDPR